MDNYASNAMDASHMTARHNQPQPPHPSEMTHNPQGQLPHMFGAHPSNFNNEPNNAYPQIHMPPPMQRQIAQQANPNLTAMQTQYPPAPYPNPAGPPPVSASTAAFPPGRPRDWETPDQRAAIERESKRARPYQPSSNDPSYTTQQAVQFNRNPPIGMPPHHHGQGPVGIAPGQQIPRMPPTNAPAIHPPSHPFVARNTFTAPMSMPTRGPPARQRDDFQHPRKSGAQYSSQPPSQPTSYDSLPAPPRKDVQSMPDRKKGPASDLTPGDKSEPKQREENPISFKDFLLKQPDTISPQDAKEKYDLYVREFARKKPNKFFNMHKDEEWFKERYDPDYVLARAERIKEEVKARARDFKELWDKGGSAVCAPDISSASLDKKQEQRLQQGHSEDHEEQEEVETEDHKGKDAEGPHEQKAEQNKVEAIGKEENEGRNAETAEEVKQEATSIKDDGTTHAPELKDEDKPANINSGKAEDVEDKVKAEPSIDRGKEDGNRKAEEVTLPAEAQSETSEIREAIEKTAVMNDKETGGIQTVAPNAVPVQKDRKTFHGLFLPLRREHQKHTIFMRGIPVNLKRKDLTEVLQRGSNGKMDLQLRRLKIGDINPMRGLERFAWAVYASEEAAAIAIEKVRGVIVRSKPNKSSGESQSSVKSGPDGGEDETCVYEIDCMINLQRKKRYTQGRILPPVLGTAERMTHDVTQSIKMMRYLDKLRDLDEGLNPLTDEVLKELPSDASRLDHVVTYLREVHYFCYYSGNEFLEDSTSMPPQELRPCGERLNRTMSDNDFRVVKRVDERAKWVLERDYDRPRSNSDSAELAKKTAIQRWLDSNTKNEGQGRYRCGLPPHKLFKGPEFVHKHLRTKHADKMESVIAKAYLDTYRANFENDPSKDEVISIYNDGLASAQQKTSAGRPVVNQQPRQAQQFGFPQGRPSAPVSMYNPAGGFMGMGMQPFPMMMMPSAAGYPAAYTAAGGYPNAMAMAGRGMGGMPGQRMNPSVMQMGMQGVDNASVQGHANQRNRDGSRDFRDGGYRGGGYRDGGYRGGRRGGYVRRGGDQYRRAHGDGRPLDPRASGPRRTYNDLDAPANGPSFDLVRYDEV